MIRFILTAFFCSYWLKEYYIVESGFSTDDAIEIMDENRGHIYVKEFFPNNDENDESIRTIDQEPEQGMFYIDLILLKEFLFYSSYERTF